MQPRSLRSGWKDVKPIFFPLHPPTPQKSTQQQTPKKKKKRAPPPHNGIPHPFFFFFFFTHSIMVVGSILKQTHKSSRSQQVSPPSKKIIIKYSFPLFSIIPTHTREDECVCVWGGGMEGGEGEWGEKEKFLCPPPSGKKKEKTYEKKLFLQIQRHRFFLSLLLSGIFLRLFVRREKEERKKLPLDMIAGIDQREREEEELLFLRGEKCCVHRRGNHKVKVLCEFFFLFYFFNSVSRRWDGFWPSYRGTKYIHIILWEIFLG